VAALSRELLRSDTEWIAIDDVTAAGSVRRAAIRMAGRLGFNAGRTGDVGIVTTEISSNLFRHADRGVIAIQVAMRAGLPGVQIVSIDHGPGMTDFTAFSTDGRSSAGTLGVGLGAVVRLSDSLDVSSQPGIGTVLVAGMWAVPPTAIDAIDIGGVTRPIPTEDVCGDALAGRDSEGHHIFMVADGLGHGPLAAASSQEAVRGFYETDETDPRQVFAGIHARLGHTRGAALVIGSVDPDFHRLRVVGVGNISGFIVREGRRRPVISYPGIVGHQVAAVRQLEFDIEQDAILVFHSDGLQESWDLARVAGLSRRTAPVIAASLLRDAGSRRDDASALVIRKNNR
jgi:anti-sigma regulatory factor (Ser/Thr protein kinase)